jgi:hypothetical protein
MKRLFVFLICLHLFAGSGLIFAAEEVERMSYACRDLSGALRWQAEAEITKVRDNVYIIVEKAEGLYSSFDGRISWVARMEFERTKDNVRPLRLDKRVFDKRGDMIRHETQEFDLAGNTGTCTHEEPIRNISRTRKFRFDKDVVTRLSLGPYVRKMLESGKARERVQMVSEEPSAYEVELSVWGKDTIEIAGRKRTACRICIDPKLGIFDLVKILLPKAYAWHSAGPNYEWLRYAGLEGGIHSAKVVVTVTDHDRKTF